ncbi:OmpA family protein [Aureispira sp. CCB-QB1]|uniref:OmpA family protein n=1 Tax=Aureispira sp. CCB-QB1 TaxID=1313421 RepID=UPI000695AB11|nr:OmpA family protein [Aureispira sp. CCB-QB1]
MKKTTPNIILFLLFLLVTEFASAQTAHNYTDHKPVYRKWLDSYILDKIEYTPNSTIFYFRFVCDNARSGGATFYPPEGESPWYLRGRDVKKEFDITAVKNVRRDGVLIKEDVSTEAFHADPPSKIGHSIFSCEVHFPRLDDDMKEADLIEGRGQEFNRRHFNCFNIKLKTWNDADLGDETDSKSVVENFEKKYVGNPTTTTNTNPSPTEKAATAYKNLHSSEDLTCNQLLVLDNIKFHDNSTKFKGMIAANKTLNIIFNYLREHPKSSISLYGHSDIFGSEDRNLELSKQRVVKIQRWLTMYGIKQHRVNYEYFGSTKPLIKEGSILNRRVEIKIHCNE